MASVCGSRSREADYDCEDVRRDRSPRSRGEVIVLDRYLLAAEVCVREHRRGGMTGL